MPSLLYLTEVFCPWCYGFAPVMERIHRKYSLPVRVICGCLREERTPLSVLAAKMSDAPAFFARLAATTGQTVSNKYLNMLLGDGNTRVFMDSPQAGRIFYTLKTLAPGNDLEIMEALQNAVYGQGKDVLASENIAEIAGRFHISGQSLAGALEDSAYAVQAAEEVEEGFDIMGDIVLYPCLYFAENGREPVLVSRGFTPLETVQATLDGLLAGNGRLQAVSGPVCSQDGFCTL